MLQFPPVDFQHATQIVGWRDPIDINVAWDVMDFWFNFDFICTYFLDGSHTVNWRTSTGWSLLGWYTYPVSNFGQGAYILAHGYSFYQNTAFPLCAGTVSASVYDNRIEGDESGGAYMSYNADVSGPACTYLLHLWIDQQLLTP